MNKPFVMNRSKIQFLNYNRKGQWVKEGLQHSYTHPLTADSKSGLPG